MELDPYQEKARLTQEAKVLLVAPPGSGKTTVLLAKIEYLMEELKVSPKEILVLTFSRSASSNMKARFEKKRLEAPFFGTIHSFAWREIQGQTNQRKLITEGQAMAALSALRRKYHLDPEEIAGCISDISRERSTGLPDETIPLKFREEVRMAYQNYKTEAALLDFDDLEEELLVLLEDPELREEVQSRYRWILVDEFQDLNPVQLKILKIIAKKSRLFCVGDEDQCIYAFRGSDTTAMIRFAEEFPGGRILYLKYNYRSSASIVAYANRIIAHNKERYAKEIVNFRQDETKLEWIRTQDETAGYELISKQLHALGSKETCALILRTNAEVEEAAHFLVRKNIRFALLDQVYNKYQRRTIKPLIDYLRYGAGWPKNQGKLFAQLVRRTELGLPEELLSLLEASELVTEQDLLKDEKYSLNGPQRENLLKWFRDVGKLKKQKPDKAIRFVLYVMGYYKWLVKTAQSTGACLRDLVREAEELAEEAAHFPDIPDFLRYLDAYAEICSHRDEGARILLSTMHGVKGMEFDAVFIPGAVEGKIPHEKALSELEAERRLFYVAVTRAKHRLTILIPQTCQGKAMKESRFLTESRLPGEAPYDEAAPTQSDRRFVLSSIKSGAILRKIEKIFAAASGK